jgi:hypothetical protein
MDDDIEISKDCGICPKCANWLPPTEFCNCPDQERIVALESALRRK